MEEKKYTAPRTDPVFVKYWDLFISDVTERENFKEGHLQQLSILCDLYQDYNTFTEYLRTKGYTYESDGRYGEAHKPYPEVAMREKALSEIRQYTKILGIALKEDRKMNTKDEVDEWD